MVENKLKQHYKTASEYGEVIAVVLYGSQNYTESLVIPNSDVDCKAIMKPSMENLLFSKNRHIKELTTVDKEKIVMMDVGVMAEMLMKPSLVNYELLFSKYSIVNGEYAEKWNGVLKLRDEIVQYNPKKLAMSLMGMSYSMLQNLDSPNGGEHNDVQLFGYSRKRFANIARYNATIRAYLQGEEFADCLTALPQESFLGFRTYDVYSRDEAFRMAKKWDDETKTYAKTTQYMNDKAGVREKLEKAMLEIML